MHPRHRSKCVTISRDIGCSPCSPSPIKTIRPRGESASLPHSTYVGHVSRQKPQWTQSSNTSVCGGLNVSNAIAPTSGAPLDPSDEDAGITGPSWIKAHLDPAHQLE